MRTALTLLLLVCAPASAQTTTSDLYTITADDTRVDTASGITTYRGDAKVVVANVVIEADTISIFQQDGLPVRIQAAGEPIRFYETVPRKQINGTARTAEFLLSEFKLTLTDYAITDPAGNRMKGKKASFILAP